MLDITRTSAQSGITRTLTLDVTLDEYRSWKQGELIQRAMPRLGADEREFIMTGITAEEWENHFGE